jgi:hypothetical protein
MFQRRHRQGVGTLWIEREDRGAQEIEQHLWRYGAFTESCRDDAIRTSKNRQTISFDTLTRCNLSHLSYSSDTLTRKPEMRPEGLGASCDGFSPFEGRPFHFGRAALFLPLVQIVTARFRLAKTRSDALAPRQRSFGRV